MKAKATGLMIQVQEKTEIERLISILSIGLCTAIEQGVLTIEAAERYLYSPYTLERLAELGVSPQVSHLIHLGTELEDVESLLPEHFATSVCEMKNDAMAILRALPPQAKSNTKWIQAIPTNANLQPISNGKTSQILPEKIQLPAT